MPPRNKKQNAPASEKRHDSGLIAPGKRISKDKQQQSSSSASSAITSSADVAQRVTVPAVVQSSPSAPTTPAPGEDAVNEHATLDAPSDTSRFSRPAHGALGSANESVDAGDSETAAPPLSEAGPHHPLANGHFVKHAAPADACSTSLQPVSAVIRPHSSWDVFAILLLLLQLPASLIVLTELGFSGLTLGTNTNIFSLFGILSAPDWFRGHGGNLSLVATLVIDFAFLCIGSFLPNLIADLILDFAPAVIALALGGGATAKHSWRHVLLCLLTVSLCRIIQVRRRLHYSVSLVGTALSKFGLAYPPFLASWTSAQSFQLPPSRWRLRIMLQVHIIAYGCIRVVRHWLDRSLQQSNGGRNTLLRSESESFAATPSNSMPHTAGDSTPDGIRNAASTDGRPPGQHPAPRDKNLLSGKKRRKQATVVRSRQPFWAAIATTKIQVSKEFEQSHAERDNFEATATNLQSLGDASSKALDDRIWITRVDETQVVFVANMHDIATPKSAAAADATSDDASSSNNNNSSPNSRRGSREPLPFDVRINGAAWSSVDIQQTNGGKSSMHTSTQPSGTQFKIFDLTPGSTYNMEFLRAGEESLIFVTTLLTPLDETSAPVAAPVVQPQDPTRPSSPITTLKQSIETAEAKLAEQKGRYNRSRKTRQASTRSMKQDIGELNRNLSSANTNERHQQRQTQIRQNIKQAEEQTSELASRLANFGEIPETDQEEFETSKANWAQVDDQRQLLKKAVESSKRDGQRRMTEANQENERLRTKKTKTESRLSALTERRKNTLEEIEAKRKAKGQVEAQHAYKMDKLRDSEQSMMRDLSMLEGQRRELESQIAHMVSQQESMFDGGFAPTGKGPVNLPPTPESHYSGLMGGGARGGLAMNSFGMGGYSSAVGPTGQQPPQSQQQHMPTRSRGRSSSMLSDISGFTDEETSSPQQYGMKASQYPSAISGRDIVRNGSGSPRNGGPNLSQKPSPIGSEAARISPRQLKR